MRIGVIGCGMIASVYHGPAIAHYKNLHPDVQLTVCCDVDAAKTRQFADTFGFEQTEIDVGAMLRRHKLDAIFLFASEKVVCDIACQVAQADVSLLLEKPPGRTSAELERMIEAFRDRDVLVDVAFNRRYMPLVQSLAAQIDRQSMQHIHYEMSRWNRRDADFSATAIHGIDLVRWLAGCDYQSIKIEYQAVPDTSVVNFYLTCSMTSGATAFLSFCPMAGGIAERVSMLSRDHSHYLELPVWNSIDAPGRLRQIAGGHLQSDTIGESDNQSFVAYGFYGEDAAFLDAVRNGQRGMMGLERSRQVVAIAEAIQRRAPHFSTEFSTPFRTITA